MGVDYKIYATGGKKGGFMNEWQGVFNYKLYLSSSRNGQLINQLLIAHPDIREMISMLFAGDIDGDGFLDLLIKNNFWEHEEINTLFLSKLTNPLVNATKDKKPTQKKYSISW